MGVGGTGVVLGVGCLKHPLGPAIDSNFLIGHGLVDMDGGMVEGGLLHLPDGEELLVVEVDLAGHNPTFLNLLAHR